MCQRPLPLGEGGASHILSFAAGGSLSIRVFPPQFGRNRRSPRGLRPSYESFRVRKYGSKAAPCGGRRPRICRSAGGRCRTRRGCGPPSSEPPRDLRCRPGVDSFRRPDGGSLRRQGKYAPVSAAALHGARRIRTADLLGAIGSWLLASRANPAWGATLRRSLFTFE